MKFLIDMPLPPTLAVRLVDRGHDAVHAVHLGLDRAADSEIMSRARSEGRTIVTADLDYRRLLAIAQDIEPSVILFRNGNWSEMEIGERLEEILATLSDEDIEQSIIVVDRDRVRRRRLPLG